MGDIEKALLADGYVKEDHAWSFTPVFQNVSPEYYWNKKIPYQEDEIIDVGVLVNESYSSMAVYTCDCLVGCCGRFQGIHPFSIETLNSLIEDERAFLDEIHGHSEN